MRPVRLALFGFMIANASAQVMVSPERVPKAFQDFDAIVAEKPLKCEIMAVKPRLDFGFRFQAGYAIRIPLNQYSGPRHNWAMLTRVTPEGGSPVYLLNAVRLPNIPPTKSVAETGGAYLLGEGRYQVEQLLVDDLGRACRKKWTVDARRTHAERNMNMRLPAGTVQWLGARRKSAEAPTTRPYRITILVHAAPLFPRSTRLRAFDRAVLLGSLGPLLDQLPAERVRLIVFNLDQQKRLFEKEDFVIGDVDRIVQALNGIELGVVDYSVLKNTAGHIELLAELVNAELESKDRSDAVIIIGPASRYFQKVPESVLAERSGNDPLFFDLRYSPLFARGGEFPDLIQNVVRGQRGKVLIIHTPGEFATALQQIASRLESKLSGPGRATP